MKKYKASTTLELDRRRQKKDGSYPLKLMVIHNRKFKRYKTDYSFTEEQYEEVLGNKKHRKHKDLRLEINALENKANEIIEKLPEFTFDAFERRFNRKSSSQVELFGGFDEYIEQLLEEERINTATNYRYAKKSLQKFTGKSKLYLSDVTINFLKKYEAWMVANKRSLTTVGYYTRDLQHIYNRFVEEHGLIIDKHPFGKGKYEIPNTKKVNKALNIQEIKEIYNYQPEEGSSEHLYRDIFLFAYFSNGISMCDICLLQNKNFDKGNFSYIRKKTAKSRKNAAPIIVPLIPETRAIMERWGTKSKDPDAFIFPFIKNADDPYKVITDISNATNQVNKYIKRIAKKVGAEEKVSSYYARHTFATILKRNSINATFIQESLGHSNIRTTENYLGSFEDEQKQDVAKNLTKWGK